MLKKSILFFVYLIVSLHLTFDSQAVSRMEEIKVQDNLGNELIYMLNLIGNPNRKSEEFKSEHITHLLDFVTQQKNGSALYHAGKKLGAPSAYYEFDIHRNLDHILRYAFNPGIPYCVIAPSSVRICRSIEVEGRKQPLPALDKLLPGMDKPVILTGVEHVVNTPDPLTGAYYSYEVDRKFILFKHQGRNVLVTISKQRGKSDSGKKGLILGSDDNWDYVYTGQDGITKPGLGWVRTYMYDSYGIIVYYEIDSEKPLVKCGIFKWIRAGWANLNMVQTKHIYSGMRRFAKAFKSVIENPQLPPPSELAGIFSSIEQLPIEILKKKTENHLKILAKRYSHDEEFPNKWQEQIIKDENYLNQLNSEEMQSMLFIEAIKQVLGKAKP
jgi:hypothetical protein